MRKMRKPVAERRQIPSRKPILAELIRLGKQVSVSVQIGPSSLSSLKATLEAIRNQRVKK